uniref:rho guanine nucleotide exchange factor 15-like n=1 Tax=Pristiophorus japonicus TaxID=55135 RepID=UPI00398E8D21
MAATVKAPTETEMPKQAAKPPLKPKPAALAHVAGTQPSASLGPSAEGPRSVAQARPPRPPAPARPPASGGEALSGSGNVRLMRELFSQAAGAAAKGKPPPQGLKRSESARDATDGALPVPKARRRRTPKWAPRQDAVTDRGGGGLALEPAKAPVGDLQPSQEVSTGLRLEGTPEHSDASEEGEAAWRCSSGCPCVCHAKRPGMVLVWRRAGTSGTSSSDSSEDGGAGPFRFLLHITDAEPEGGGEARDANGSRCDVAEESGEAAAAAEREDGARTPPTVPEQAGEGDAGPLPPKPDDRHEVMTPLDEMPRRAEEPAPAGGATPVPGADGRPVAAARQPKPPRRSKPPAEAKEAPRVPSRRPAVNRRPGAEPARIRQRYTAGDLDKISKCVDGLNLHIQKLELPRLSQASLPIPLRLFTSGNLKPPCPKVTRSAPPSPKEKHLQTIYDEIDIGDVGASSSNEYEVHLEIHENRSINAGTQKATDWESQFESEPLYQTYRETVIHKEIKRQTLMRDSSKTSEDYMYESIPLTLDNDRASSPGARSQTPRNTLWQNLDAVRQSGILSDLSQGECRLQESMFEVLTSEASYLRSLNVLIEHFMDSKDLNETIIVRDKKTLFSCVTRVNEVSESFLKDLEGRMDESIKINDVCDIIYSHAQHNFQVYVDYVRNQLYQEQKYRQLMEENAQFAAAVVRLQEMPRCQRLPLMSFLLLPFQRITRIKMLIENILQRSEVGSANEETASKALSLVSKIIEECNTEVGIMKQMEEMIHIGKKLEFDKLKAIPIISQLRHLEKRGELSEIVFRGNRFGMKPKVTPLYFFLFNDLLLITSKKSGDRYQVVDHAHRSLVEVQECSGNSPGSAMGNCFVLTLLENHQGKQADRLLRTSTESDRHRWMDALKSGKQNQLEDSKDDKIYERWDCPQVQCLIPYTAQQTDELSLEAADIINVIRKSSEGWFEGTKLSSGKKGWFPSRNVQEITNEHVRRRNLRDRYRLLQAAQQLLQTQDGEAAKSANVPL